MTSEELFAAYAAASWVPDYRSPYSPVEILNQICHKICSGDPVDGMFEIIFALQWNDGREKDARLPREMMNNLLDLTEVADLLESLEERRAGSGRQ